MPTENPEFPWFLGNSWFSGMFSSVTDEIPALLYSQLCFPIYRIRPCWFLKYRQQENTSVKVPCKWRGPFARWGALMIWITGTVWPLPWFWMFTLGYGPLPDSSLPTCCEFQDSSCLSKEASDPVLEASLYHPLQYTHAIHKKIKMGRSILVTIEWLVLC